jgi:hypothetical protein
MKDSRSRVRRVEGQVELPLALERAENGDKRLSPKRPPIDTSGLADLFPYYAGFSFDWACGELRNRREDGTPKVVLDPWNGSGTTTLAARYDGHVSMGVDLNPAANIVAQLRCQVSQDAEKLPRPRRTRRRVSIDDPLTSWFTSSTIVRLRDWTRSAESQPLAKSALGRVALFRVVRELTNSFQGTNPTWVRRSKTEDDLIDSDPDELDALILQEQAFLLERLASAPTLSASTQIITGSSAALPLQDSSIDLILTSPPYLTRIDYAVAYSRELAVLGVDISRDRTLRAGLMGTTLIRRVNPYSGVFGDVATQLLLKISKHESKASSGYYLKQARQYLDDLCLGFDEVTRVSKAGARLCMVVQDSYYKDIHVPLAEMCIDEAVKRGWVLDLHEPFPVTRSLMSMNRLAREYEKGVVDESVISFTLK